MKKDLNMENLRILSKKIKEDLEELQRIIDKIMGEEE